MNICGYGREGIWKVNDQSMKILVSNIEEKFNVESSETIHKSISGPLKTAGEMFLYLLECDSSDYTWMLSLRTILKTQTISQILLTINRILTKTRELQKNTSSSSEENVVVHLVLGKVFKSLESKYSLQFRKIKKQMQKGQNSFLGTPIEMLSGTQTFMSPLLSFIIIFSESASRAFCLWRKETGPISFHTIL